MCPEHFLVVPAAGFVLLVGTSCCEQTPLVMTLLNLAVFVALTQEGGAAFLARGAALGVLGWAPTALPPDPLLCPLHQPRAHLLHHSAVTLGGAVNAALTWHVCECGAASVAQVGQPWRCVGCGGAPAVYVAEAALGVAVGLLWGVGGVEGTG